MVFLRQDMLVCPACTGADSLTAEDGSRGPYAFSVTSCFGNVIALAGLTLMQAAAGARAASAFALGRPLPFALPFQL